MVGSMDSLDFCTELPMTEKNAIPLDCWQDICLSNIWIPSHLLPNRSKPRNTRDTQGIYHTLEKKDFTKYADSFSIYSFSDVESEQGEIFVSDSDEDFFGSDSTSFERLETLSDNTLPAVTDLVCPLNNAYINNMGNCIETSILNKNSERKDNENINLIANEGNSSDLKEMYCGGAEKVKEAISSEENLMNCGKNLVKDRNGMEKVRDVISSEENLMNSRKNLEQEGNVCVKNLSKSDTTESQINFAGLKNILDVKTSDFNDGVMQALGKGNKDSDSFTSLNEILDITSEVSMKDFAYDLKKKSDRDFLCAYDNQEKNSKKIKKNKGKKKPSKYVTLDKFLEDSVDISQDFYCDKYVQNILKDKFKNGSVSDDVLIGSNAEFPSLVTGECKFIHSDKTRKEINKNENFVDVGEIKPSMTDTKYGKIIIENIPLDITKDDLSMILCGYGELKNLSLVSTGNFLTAYAEIDLICDIDWIIECLNGSESFGAVGEKLKCYKQ